ncbi:hypothetical protein Nmel_011255 [Mimus melanotis]
MEGAAVLSAATRTLLKESLIIYVIWTTSITALQTVLTEVQAHSSWATQVRCLWSRQPDRGISIKQCMSGKVGF